MDYIKISKKPRLRNPYLIVAWPGMGEVAFKAARHLVEKLGAHEFASIAPEEFFYQTASAIDAGILSLPELPENKFYYWKNKNGKNDLVIFVSNSQPDLTKAEGYCREILHLAKNFKIKMVVGFAAMPQPVDHTHVPGVWFAGTSKEVNEQLKNFNLNLLSTGQISGMNGLFLGRAKREGYEGFCLLGEIPLYTIQIENPKASCAVLEVFARILNIELDLGALLQQAHIMEDEINKLLDYLKVGPQGLGPIGDEEIEKIKKSLSQLTKLPVSVKENIERLFLEAKKDIGKAGQLKAELDKWSAYKEYEDRFLDLFKKQKDKGN